MPISLGTESPRDMAFSPAGDVLYVANGAGGSSSFHYYNVNTGTGQLGEASGSPASIGAGPVLFLVASPHVSCTRASRPQISMGSHFRGLAVADPRGPLRGVRHRPPPGNGHQSGAVRVDVVHRAADAFHRRHIGCVDLRRCISNERQQRRHRASPDDPRAVREPPSSEQIEVHAVDGAGQPTDTPMQQCHRWRQRAFCSAPLAGCTSPIPLGMAASPL